MKSYMEFIEASHLVRNLGSTMTTGDVDYPGTALEVEEDETELFHVIVDSHGQRQVLFLAHRENYRVSLELLEQVFQAAKEKVVTIAE